VGIKSISVPSIINDDGQTLISGNRIADSVSFTKSDGSTGSIYDVRFDANQYDSKYAGDTSVNPSAAAMANLKGHGTLADLHVTLSQNSSAPAGKIEETGRPTPGSRP
jgi:hypothetical protein